MVSNEFPPSLGGVQTHVYELSRALIQNGHQVHVITRKRDKSWPSNEVMDGIMVTRLELPDSHFIYNWKLGRKISKINKKTPFDVIHVHGMQPLKSAVRTNIPVIFTNHTSGFLKRVEQGKLQLIKMRKQLAQCALVLAPSKELIEATQKTGHPGPYSFIANGVDNRKFYPSDSPIRSKLGIPKAAFVVILARRLVEKNGVLFFANALVSLEDPNIHFIIAGDGADGDAFDAIIENAPCASRVHRLGGVLNNDMPNIFRAGDCAVLPSLMEATSISGLEAMSSGLALIGTRVGGIPVIIEDNVTGLLVPPRDPAALACAITQLSTDRVSTNRMGEKAVEKIELEFTWKRIAEKTAEAYNSVI